MNTNFRRVYSVNNELYLEEMNLSDIVIDRDIYIGIDGATGNSGVAIIDNNCNLIAVGDVSRSKGENESAVRFKINFKRLMTEFIDKNYKHIKGIIYEEPCIAHVTAIKNLFMLRGFIEEIIIENEPKFDSIEYKEVNNTRWKKAFLGEEIKLKATGEEQKEQVREKLFKYSKRFNELSYDITDSIGLVVAYVSSMKTGEDLGKRKYIKEFAYNIDFIGADYEEVDDINETISYIVNEFYKGPEKLKNNTINICELTGKEKSFDREVCRVIGEEDNIAIVYFNKDKFGNIILKYRLGDIVKNSDVIFAVAWRKTRK